MRVLNNFFERSAFKDYVSRAITMHAALDAVVYGIIGQWT